MTNIRVLIADDEPEVRGALAALIDSEDSLELVGAAGDAHEAVEIARANHPHVALVDVKMPGGGGQLATREILQSSPQTSVLALSAYEDRATVMTMLTAGAVGYLVKGTPPDEIVLAISRAARGQASVSSEVMASVVHELSSKLQLENVESEELRERMERVRQVIGGDGLTIYFQPIFDLSDRSIAGMEALARFAPKPPRTPDVWFAEAANVGLGTELELVAVNAALDLATRLPPGAYLALNSSHRTASSDIFREIVAAAPRPIVLELTEHEPVQDYEALGSAIDVLREHGVRLAIDDAGAGYASLRHALRLAPEIIKIDMSITRNVDTDRGRRALAAALIRFAEEMGMAAVAEGVETQTELDTLLELGASYGQGFLLARPEPLE